MFRGASLRSHGVWCSLYFGVHPFGPSGRPIEFQLFPRSFSVFRVFRRYEDMPVFVLFGRAARAGPIGSVSG